MCWIWRIWFSMLHFVFIRFNSKNCNTVSSSLKVWLVNIQITSEMIYLSIYSAYLVSSPVPVIKLNAQNAYTYFPPSRCVANLHSLSAIASIKSCDSGTSRHQTALTSAQKIVRWKDVGMLSVTNDRKSLSICPDRAASHGARCYRQ